MLPFASAMLMVAPAVSGGGGGGGGGYTALRLRSTANGGTHRTSIGELDFMLGGSEISKTGTTAFDGGAGTAEGAPSSAFDDDITTSWSRSSSFGVAYVGLIYPSAVTPDAVRISSGDIDIFGQQTPSAFVIEASTDTTTGADGTWTTIYTGTASWSGAEQTQTFTF